MLRERWTNRARADLMWIEAFWTDAQPTLLPPVLTAISQRVAWLCAGNYLLGPEVEGYGPEFRSVAERRFGFRIYYRVEGDPAHTIAILRVRHGRQRPLDPASLRRAGEE
jgi:plasmid stabilization system protein ParE